MRFAFPPFVLDTDRRLLLRDGAEVKVQPKALQLLEVLLESRPRVISKAELFDRLWPGLFVSDASLAVAVAALRRALGETASAPRFVRTVHGFGYGWGGEATPLDEAPGEGAGAPSPAWAGCRLLWHRREIPLRRGENLLGRDPAAVVVIDDAAVSRRHARVVVAGAGEGSVVTLEDLASKNGTHLNGAPLAAPTSLSDGDEIGIGPVTLIFRRGAVQATTLTEGRR